jgi:hydroxymethylbilane synthase
MTRPLVAGTRGSALALWQTERVRAALSASGVASERIEIRTTGDANQEVSLSAIGTRALFTKELDEALLAGRIDFAVHSLKDLPTELPDGIVLATVGMREDARDALVGRGPLGWMQVPPRAVVATSSLRRTAQLRLARPDLTIVDIRGNVDTRLRKLDEHPEWTATILAAAGLVRLGLEHRIGERLSFGLMLPAPGQGALACTARADDRATIAALRQAMHDESAALATAAERAFLRELEGGCQVPVSAHATVERGDLVLLGRVTALDGGLSFGGREAGPVAGEPDAEALGVALARRLVGQGAGEILAALRSDPTR